MALMFGTGLAYGGIYLRPCCSTGQLYAETWLRDGYPMPGIDLAYGPTATALLGPSAFLWIEVRIALRVQCTRARAARTRRLVLTHAYGFVPGVQQATAARGPAEKGGTTQRTDDLRPGSTPRYGPTHSLRAPRY
eukprot:3940481-Rhodomonas_salina.4